MSVTKRHYSAEFKAEAIELAGRIGVPKASTELGINQANLNRWRSLNKGQTPTPAGRSMAEVEKENRRLQRENGYLKKINEVLKKSTAIFSKDHIPL
jgi:transposase